MGDSKECPPCLRSRPTWTPITAGARLPRRYTNSPRLVLSHEYSPTHTHANLPLSHTDSVGANASANAAFVRTFTADPMLLSFVDHVLPAAVCDDGVRAGQDSDGEEDSDADSMWSDCDSIAGSGAGAGGGAEGINPQLLSLFGWAGRPIQRALRLCLTREQPEALRLHLALLQAAHSLVACGAATGKEPSLAAGAAAQLTPVQLLDAANVALVLAYHGLPGSLQQHKDSLLPPSFVESLRRVLRPPAPGAAWLRNCVAAAAHFAVEGEASASPLLSLGTTSGGGSGDEAAEARLMAALLLLWNVPQGVDMKPASLPLRALRLRGSLPPLAALYDHSLAAATS